MNIDEQTIASHLSLEAQRPMLAEVRDVCRLAPLLDIRTQSGKPMSVRVTNAGRLGWVSDGLGYRYIDEHAETGKPWPPIPARWVELADSFAGRQAWDCAVVNWYEPGAKLGEHQDISEHDLDSPIVTFSLGDPARWSVRIGRERARCVLPSGAVTLLEGHSRLAYHGVDQVQADPMFSPLGPVRGRVSVTMRVAGE